MSRPPLELAVEVVNASGRVTRWDGDSKSAGNVPTGISFGTKRGDGFADGPSIILNRRIDRDWSDINLYDTLRLVGADGSIAYDGYISADPRSFDGGHTITVRTAGPMTFAQQRPFSEIYVDRDLSQWSGLSVARDTTLIGAGFSPADGSQSPDASGNAALATEFTDSGAWTSTTKPLAGMMYAAPDGVTLGKLYYEWTKGANVDPSGTDTNWTWNAALSDDDSFATAVDITSNLRGGSTTGTLAATASTRAYALLQLFYNAAGGSGTNDLFAIYWSNTAAIGTHGLTLRPSTTPGPGGLYVSDVIVDICNRFAPALNPSGVQQTTYPVDHVTFAQAQPYDAWLSLNKYHLWELNVWENRQLCYYPADLTTYDWQIRLDDPGVTVDLPGDSTESLANGIVVSYLDVTTGRTQVVTPDDSDDLKDPNPLNPATLHSLTVWTSVDLTSIPLSQADAIQIGAAKLAEYNQAKAAGTIKVTGHIRDRAGNWQPVWKVRASQTIAIVNHPDSRPRLIGETSYDHDSLTNTIAVDNTLNRMDAYIDRLSAALTAGNVGSFPTS